MKKKYFGTDGIRGKVGVLPISADWILKLGWAVGKVFSTQGHGKVLIGKDTRISGYMFESALEAGLVAAGANVHLLGPMPTPSIAYLTRTLQADVGIVISASHNPYTDNGIKFFSPEGSKLSDEVEQAIESQIELVMNTVAAEQLGRAVRVKDAPGRYIEFCKSTFPNRLHLKQLKIVLDCANGAAYHVAPSVFQELGAEVIAIADKPDGFNINKQCGATKPEHLAAQVVIENADLGIALDGDGDRLIMVDHTGTVVDGDELLYVITKWYLEQGIEFGGVVGTVMSNLGLELALQAAGIPFCRAQVGDRHVISELKKRDWLLGGESSGHLICLDAHSTGDGIISALKVLAAVVSSGKSLLELRRAMKKYPQVLLNVPVQQTANLQDPVIQEAVEAAQATLKKEGRILLRPSGTEPLVRVMVEGRVKSKVEKIAQTLKDVVSKQLYAVS